MSRTWLITGAARGFGRHLSEAVLENGDRLIATARRPEQLDDLRAVHGERIRSVALDVTDRNAVTRVVNEAHDLWGGLDVVVNNAGYANSASIEETSEEDFRAQIETNLFGVVNVTRAALPRMRTRRTGTFVQFSSIGGRVGGTPGLGAYQTAKFGVEGFAEVLANETAPLGLRVVIVEPGAFRTDWQGSSMTMHPVGPDYEATVGALHRYRQDTDGRQPGDPARAARIIVDVVGSDDPPRRLVLGADAVTLALKAGDERAAETEKWADVSRAADFPGSEVGSDD